MYDGFSSCSTAAGGYDGDDGGGTPQHRGPSLNVLHGDLLDTLTHGLEGRLSSEQMAALHRRVEDLLARDATERTRRLHELKAMYESTERIDQQRQEEEERIADLCRQSVSHLLKECQLYNDELLRLRQENAELGDVKSELTLLRSEGQEMAEALRQKTEELAALQSRMLDHLHRDHERDVYTHKAEELAVHLVQAVQERQEAEEHARELQTRLDAASEESEALNKQLQGMQTRLEEYEVAATADIQELRARDEQRMGDLQVQSEQIAALQSRIQIASAELASKSAELQRAKEQLEEQEHRYATQIADLRAQLKGRCEALEALQGTVHTQAKQIDELREGAASAARELATKQQTIESLTTRNDQLVSEMRQLRSRADDEVAAARRRGDEMAHEAQRKGGEEANALRDAMNGLRDTIDHLREREKALSAELEGERQAAHDLSNTVRELQRQNLQLAQEKGRAQAEVKIMRNSFPDPEGGSSRSTSHMPVLPSPSPKTAGRTANQQRLLKLEDSLANMKEELRSLSAPSSVRRYNPLGTSARSSGSPPASM